MTIFSEIKKYLEDKKTFIMVFVAATVTFWLLYFYFNLKLLHNKNTAIIVERLDEIIQQIDSNATHLSNYRPISSSLTLNAPLSAEHLLQQWIVNNNYVDTVVLLQKNGEFFAMNKSDKDLRYRLFFQDIAWNQLTF